MDFDGQTHPFLDGPDQLRAVHGAQEARHVLDGDGVRPHLRHPLSHLREGLQGVNWGQGVGDAELEVRPLLLHLVRRRLHVAQVVQRVEDADDVDAVAHGALDELPRHVVRVVTVAHQVLATQEHLQLRLLDPGPDQAQAVPRVLVQEAHAAVERRASPHLKGPIARLVHPLQDGQHILRAHPRGNEGLMCVPQHRLRDANPSCLTHHKPPCSVRGAPRHADYVDY